MAKKQQDPNRPSREAQDVDASTWYYEAKGHILVVRQVRDKEGAIIATDQIKLPWRKLITSARRCGQIK